MNIHLRRLLPALLLCAAVAPLRAAPMDDPEQLQTEAYVSLVQAQQSLDADRLEEAMEQYQTAREYYLRLSTAFPDWEPRIVRYRQTDCDNKIADINRRIGARAAARTPPPDFPVPPSEKISEPADDAESLDDNTFSSNDAELDALQRRMAALKREAAQAPALREEVDRLNRELDSARQDLVDANRHLVETLGKERNELSALRVEIDEKENTIAMLQTRLDSVAEQDLVLNDMENQLNKVRAENAGLQQRLRSMERELDEALSQPPIAEPIAEPVAKEEPLPEPTPVMEPIAEPEPAVEPELETTFEPELEPAPVVELVPEPEPEPAVEPEPELIVEAPVVEPVKATVPPRRIPAKMTASEFVRNLLQNGENDVALATIQKAREDQPEDANLALIEAIALIRLQHYAAAAAMLLPLSTSEPTSGNAEIHANLGAAWMGDGFYSGAREALLEAIRLDKDIGGEYYYNLATLFAFTEPLDLRAARKYYKQALRRGIEQDPQLDEALQ